MGLARLLVVLAGLTVLSAGVSAAPTATRLVPAAAVGHGATGDAQARLATEPGKKRKRPGCGRFCRQAGGFGGGPPGKEPVLFPAQRLRVARDAIVAVRATCRLDEACVGAILVDGRRVSYGRADLRIRAHATRRVLVGVPARAMRFLRRHHRARAFATAALKGNRKVSVSSWLTILAPR